MISLHRLGHKVDVFLLNPEMIMTVEATPDTVITLTNGTKIVVAEPPERVIADVRDHKIEILAGAMDRRDTLRGERTPVRKAAPLRVSTPVTPLRVGGTESPVGSAS
jgi:uncharacterized protein YlzI (FlbEa/FlbD family)